MINARWTVRITLNREEPDKAMRVLPAPQALEQTTTAGSGCTTSWTRCSACWWRSSCRCCGMSYPSNRATRTRTCRRTDIAAVTALLTADDGLRDLGRCGGR